MKMPKTTPSEQPGPSHTRWCTCGHTTVCDCATNEVGYMRIRCGWTLCQYYDEGAPVLVCPMPIQGAACQGMGDPNEYL